MDKKHKVRTGRVISNKMDKTVVVQVETLRQHPLYHKVLRRGVRFKANDEKYECQVGDLVTIIETRPLSRDKRWRVANIISRREKAFALAKSELDIDLEKKEDDTAVHQT